MVPLSADVGRTDVGICEWLAKTWLVQVLYTDAEYHHRAKGEWKPNHKLTKVKLILIETQAWNMTICTTAGSRKHCGNTIALIGKGRDVKQRRLDFLLPEETWSTKITDMQNAPHKTCLSGPSCPCLAVNLKQKTLGVDITKICCSNLGMLKNFFITTSTEKIAHCWYTNHENSLVTNVASYRKTIFFTVMMQST